MSTSCYSGPGFRTYNIQYALCYSHWCPQNLWFNRCSFVHM